MRRNTIIFMIILVIFIIAAAIVFPIGSGGGILVRQAGQAGLGLEGRRSSGLSG